jgi:hypothetical protein
VSPQVILIVETSMSWLIESAKLIGGGVYDYRDAITAISTAVIATFTATLWWISRSQLKHSHRTERAYMSGGGVPARHSELVPGTFTQVVQRTVLTGDFELHINNHGKTPGELMKIAIEFCDAANIPIKPTYNPEPFHDWIGPGTQSRPMRRKPIPKDRPATAVYGRIYYRDIFGKNHSSGFIQSISSDGGTIPLLAPRDYNAAD